MFPISVVILEIRFEKRREINMGENGSWGEVGSFLVDQKAWNVIKEYNISQRKGNLPNVSKDKLSGRMGQFDFLRYKGLS